MILQNIGMLALGVRDSISVGWIPKILFHTDLVTKRVHPSSNHLLSCLKSSLLKILLYIIIVPSIFQYLQLTSISTFLKVVYLVLTYGYLFFYNNDVMVSTRKVLLWKQQKMPGTVFQLDKREKIELFTSLSGQIKGFIFLLFYYLPIFVIETKLLINIPVLGTIMLIVSESFFNGVFYFLKTWPYDSFNVGFIQKHMSYMLGYGLFVSIVCNYLLAQSYSTGGYLVISLWMLINSVVYSPPQDIIKILMDSKYRNSLKNSYNLHRSQVRNNPTYRKQIRKKVFIVYPALKITQIINKKISTILNKTLNQHEDQQQVILQTSDSSTTYTNPSVIVEVDEEKEESRDD